MTQTLLESTGCPSESFKCGVCAATFSSRDSLEEHLNEHVPTEIERNGKLGRRRTASKVKESVITRPFKCHLCPKAFRNGSGLDSHVRTHTGEKLFSCDVCQESFMYRARLERHKRIHTGEKPFYCHTCQKDFANKQILEEHLRIHTGEKPFGCDQCGKRFRKVADLNKHSNTHLDMSQRPYQCTLCPMGFIQKRYLNLHLMNHKGEKPHQCGECGKKFLRPDTLRRHMVSHSSERPFNCPICQKAFKSKEDIRGHMAVHNDDTPFQCDICGHQSKSKYLAKQHKLIHTDVQIKCTMCPKVFRHKATLEAHMAKHAGEKLFKCDICDMKFFVDTQRKRHVKRHKDLSPPDISKPYICRRCNFYFANKEELRSHLKSEHSGNKIYSCEQCGLVLASKSIYKRHMLLHVGEKRYECNVCMKRFTERYKLKFHLNTHVEYEDIVEEQLQNIEEERKGPKQNPHECLECGKRYSKLQYLQKHMKYHTDGRPFKCVECGIGYTYKQELKRHMMVRHQIEGEVFNEMILREQLARTEQGKWKSYGDQECLISIEHRSSKQVNEHQGSDRSTQIMIDPNLDAKNLHFEATLPNVITIVPFQREEEIEETIVLDEHTVLRTEETSHVKEQLHVVSVAGGVNKCQKVVSLKNDNVSQKRGNFEEDTVLEVVAIKKTEKEEKVNIPVSNGSNEFKHNSTPKTVKCVTCGQTFSSQDELTEHLIQDMQNALLKCKVCGLVCASGKDLEDHSSTHTGQLTLDEQDEGNQGQIGSCYLSMFTQDNDESNEDESDLSAVLQQEGNAAPADITSEKDESQVLSTVYKCQVCGELFQQLQLLDEHIKKIHGYKMLYNCEICNKTFVSTTALELHCMMYSHYPKNPDDHHSAVLENDTANEGDVNHDTEGQSDNELYTVIDDCDIGEEETEEIDDRNNYDNNDKEVIDDPAQRCSRCGKDFPTLVALRLHKMMHENDDEPFICSICDKSFKHRSSFEHHMISHTGDRGHSCTECGQSFKYKVVLERHMWTHTGETPFKCEVCGKICSTEHTLRHHRMLHTGEKPFKCDECDKGFIKPQDLKVHKYCHVPMDQRPFVCSVCGMGFGTKRRLNYHMATHTGEKPFSCSLCPAAFARKAALDRHHLKHTGEKPHKCLICGKAFRLRETMRDHMLVHSNHRPFSCEICGRKFKSEFVLKVHAKVHSEERPFQCSYCEKRFKTMNSMREHTAVHSDHKPHVCNECGRTYASLRQLQRHIRVHKVTFGKLSMCTLCGKGFRDGQRLKRHLITHTDKRPFQCAECHRAFKTSIHLQRHAETHSDIKPFQCTVCGQWFKTQRYMKSHMATHSTGQPFACPFCAKSFKLNSYLKQHMKKHLG